MSTSNGKVRGRGDPNATTLLLGEKPGKDELKVGRVFVGRTGTEIEKIAWKTGVDLDSVWLDNLLADAPTGDDWTVTNEDLQRNQGHLVDLFTTHHFDTVVCMGNVANRWALGPGVRSDVGTVHGLLHNISSHPTIPESSLRGSLGLDIFTTWHPASGLHDGDAYPYIMHDFNLLGAMLKGRWRPEYRVDRHAGSEHYTVISESDRDIKFLRYLFTRDDISPYIYVDTEGSVLSPWCLTFSLGDGEGYMIKATSRRTIEALSQEVDLAGLVVVLHYAVHDIPVLRQMGWSVVRDVDSVLDTMVAAYLLQIEPQGLKNLAYRHAGMEMKDYLDLVGPYTLDKRVDWLVKLRDVDWGKPDEVLVEEKMETKLVKPQGLNARVNKLLKKIEEAADLEGMEWIYNNEGTESVWNWWKRLKSTYPTVAQPALDTVGDIPTAHLSELPFDEALWYACRDADATCRVFKCLYNSLNVMGLIPTFHMDCRVIPEFEEMQSSGFVPNLPYFQTLKKVYRAEQGKIRHQLSQILGYVINPESSQQCEKVIYDTWRMPVFKETEGGRRSTSDKAIDWLADRHPGIKLIQKSREYDKAVSSFVDASIEKAQETESGRVMGDLKYTRVVSGRPSMSGINLLAFPVRSAIGKEIRMGFEAAPGNLLGSWDLNQIEMRFMAHESGDENLISAYQRGADIHKETATLMFGGREEDITDEQRDPAKRVGFGVITGIAGQGLRDQFYLNGITKYDADDCDEFIRIYFEARPRVKAYLERCRAEARQYGYVRESIGGRIRYLQGIGSTNKKVAAEAERASHSHKISSGAQAIIKKAQAVLWKVIDDLRKSDGVFIQWRLQVYDELILEFPEGYEGVLDTLIQEALCQTVKLRVPILAKGKWARTWGQLK